MISTSRSLPSQWLSWFQKQGDGFGLVSCITKKKERGFHHVPSWVCDPLAQHHVPEVRARCEVIADPGVTGPQFVDPSAADGHVGHFQAGPSRVSLPWIYENLPVSEHTCSLLLVVDLGVESGRGGWSCTLMNIERKCHHDGGNIWNLRSSLPYLQFPFARFELPMVVLGLKILNEKFQKEAVHTF